MLFEKYIFASIWRYCSLMDPELLIVEPELQTKVPIGLYRPEQ